MFELMKIVGVSAVLSAGFVTGSEMPADPAAEAAGGKIYTDRLDATAAEAGTIYLARNEGDAGPQTVLVRVPAPEMAQR
jgi:hypothetical protein